MKNNNFTYYINHDTGSIIKHEKDNVFQCLKQNTNIWIDCVSPFLQNNNPETDSVNNVNNITEISTEEYLNIISKWDISSYKQTWKYVKPLLSENYINDFEKLTNFSFPSSFKEHIKQYNGARPKCTLFDTDKRTERVMKSLLSFNPNDKESIWRIHEWNKLEIKDQYIPFAIDNFGNLICFDCNKQVIFLNHENLDVEYIAFDFDCFIDSLYMDADYYEDKQTGNIVRHISRHYVEYLEKNTTNWIDSTPHDGKDCNYARELYLGEGFGCLNPITEEEYLKIILKWQVNDFKFIPEYNHYSTIINGITLVIPQKSYNSQTIDYAHNLLLLFIQKEKDITEYIATKSIDFYRDRYTFDEIKEKLHKPQIEVLSENFGVLVYLNHDLDEHIIDCEFTGDIKLSHVLFNG